MGTFIRVLGWATLVSIAISVNTDTSDFDWNAVEPSWHLHYSPCYDGFQCARLLMPLDWLDAEPSNETVALSMIKLPAAVDCSDASFGGTVITNPGGPGSSGVRHVLKNGRYMQTMMDGEKHFEIMSFDPRGVAHSKPAADCYASEPARTAAAWQSRGFTNFDASAENLKYQKAFAAARGLQCAKPGPHGYAIQEYMATASVARDMVRIIDEIESLHQKALAQKLQHEAQKPVTSKPANVARLQYYGTSYGTFLGNTFMSMFPGRVKRMVLDGVIVPEDWVAADWYSSILDSEKALKYFYRSCFEATAKCPLTKSSDHSWHSIRDRVRTLLGELDASPRPALTQGGTETIITAGMVRSSLFKALYQPIDKFEPLAESLASALQGNYTLLVQNTGLGHPADGCTPKKPGEYNWLGLSSSAIVCGDAQDVTHHDEHYWQGYFEKLGDRSPEFGHNVAKIPFTCSGWKSRPKYRFTGPFSSPEADPSDKQERHSAPALLLSSWIDPITPLQNAHRVSKSHPGSRVLSQKSFGHCALYSAPSKCTNRVVRTYMTTGALPDEGAQCEPDCVPWEQCDDERTSLPR
ncbi:peptidase family S33 and alpha/beta hydrolase domain protein [Metarhizium robertsii]|uniref:Peptidase family S33 and alpha/beta hydrolase domain protein n=1 Tax=Metarhizium robertsii TaxID=568076 RepID=A0A0A1V476_9HYPO|nr:peptidase family S33 and alpha/beta hydrolase domain protein [Metarhizium robertsii]